MEGYKVEVLAGKRQLNNINIARYKNMISDTLLKDCVGNKIVVQDWTHILVNNEYAKDNKEYEKLIVVDNDGVSYSTSSKSFIDSFLEFATLVAEELEEFEIKILEKSSKNNQGKFLLCQIL